MRRHGARWAHAARVATGATVVVAAVALVVALVVNASVANHLVRNVDARLTERLATAAASPATATTGTTTPPTPGAGGGDVDDVPAFVWRVGPDRDGPRARHERPLAPQPPLVRGDGRPGHGREHLPVRVRPIGRGVAGRRRERDPGGTGTRRPHPGRGPPRCVAPPGDLHRLVRGRPAGLGAHRADPPPPGRVHRRREPRAAHAAQRDRGRGRPGPQQGSQPRLLPGDPPAHRLGERPAPCHRRGPPLAGPDRRAGNRAGHEQPSRRGSGHLRLRLPVRRRGRRRGDRVLRPRPPERRRGDPGRRARASTAWCRCSWTTPAGTPDTEAVWMSR